VADLLKLALVAGALDQDEPLDPDAERGGHDLVHRRVRQLHPHHIAAPLATAPRAGAGNNGMLPAGPQTMRTGAGESETRVVMLNKQGELLRIIVQNLREKVKRALYEDQAPPPLTLKEASAEHVGRTARNM